MVERQRNRLLMFSVDDRDEKTLLPIIKKHIKPGSTILSDGWKAYINLNDHGYKHFSVIHKTAFKAVYKNLKTGEILEVGFLDYCPIFKTINTPLITVLTYLKVISYCKNAYFSLFQTFMNFMCKRF